MVRCPHCGFFGEDNIYCSCCGKMMIKESERKSEEDDSKELCPDCREGTLKLRHNHKTGFPFYGCSNYPRCRYTASFHNKSPTKLFEKKKFEKEDEFIQWLQKRGLENTTINTYVTAVFQYTVFLRESSSNKIAAGQKATFLKETAGNIIKNEIDPYSELKIGEIARTVLRERLSRGVSVQELSDLQDVRYCKQKFDLDYPLLSKKRLDGLGYSRYYKKGIYINGEYFYLCSQWFETPANNDRPYLLQWLSEHSLPKSSKLTVSSDIGVIATAVERITPKTVQTDKNTENQKIDSLSSEVAMKDIKECIARDEDVLSMKFDHGYTPLMIAAKCDDADVLAAIIAKLKEANGNFEERNDEGKTAYIVARESKAEKAMSLLKEAGARFDAPIITSHKK